MIALLSLGVCSGLAQAKPIMTWSYQTDSRYTAPLLVNFTSQVSQTQGDVQYIWEFGDETQSNEANPKHRYLAPGKYLVRLTVRDKTGSSSATLPLKIESAGPEQLNIMLRADADRYYTFDLSASRVYSPLVQVQWALDGQTAEGSSSNPQIFQPSTPLSVGTHQIQAYVQTQDGRMFKKMLRFQVEKLSKNSIFERQLQENINQLRAKAWNCSTETWNGVARPALQRSSLLDQAASEYAVQLASNHFLAHNSSIDDSSPKQRIQAVGYPLVASGLQLAENIARGYRDPAEVVEGWQHQLATCQRLMSEDLVQDGDFSQIGIGFVEVQDPYQQYWVVLLANPQ